MSKARILLLYTGGTIGMKKDFKTGILKPFDFGKLLENIPELIQLDCSIETMSFVNPIDSSDMNPSGWIQIANTIEEKYNSFDGFVVLHGSDTMAYSASAMSFLLENLSKPVIFTGSQLPIGDLRTDAKENVITAIQIASLRESGHPVIKEVCLYFEYKLYRGNRTTKINSEHFNAFTSPNFSELVESGVHLKINANLLLKDRSNKKLVVHKTLDTNVVIIKLFPGISENVLTSILNIPSLKGVVLETYGSGNAPTSRWFLDILEKRIKEGLHIVNVTQCPGGSVNMGQYESSNSLKNIGVISGKDITTEAAITKLMFLLTCNIDSDTFKKSFEQSICGEME